MAKIEVDEVTYQTAVEASGRVPALEAELSEARTKLAASESATVTAKAQSIVAEAFGDIEAKTTRKSLVAAALAAETFDPEALKADALEAVAEIRTERGEGNVHGAGNTTATSREAATVADADILKALKGGK